MSTDPALDQLSREELVERARALGARRPEVMTRIELRDEIVRLSESDPQARRRSRGWLGVARDLVASVMDAGLNMPGAAAAIRGDARPAEETTGPPPVATITLAEIYLAQGHADRALATLEEVLATEPEHAAALALRDRIMNERPTVVGRRRPPPSEPMSVIPEPVPAPAPFVSAQPSAATPVESPVQPSFVASVEAPEATRHPGLVETGPEPGPQPAADPVPAAAEDDDELPSALDHSTPISQPVPTMAAPPALDDSEPFAAPAAARAECALVARGGAIEGIYSLPPGVSGVVLRVAWFVPAPEGPTAGQLDVPLDPVRTRVSLPPLEDSAHVRGALGTDVAGTFQPLAVAWVYRMDAGRLSLAFSPPGSEPSHLLDEVRAFAPG
jgi:tetratricopeptide repeat protein